MNPLKNRLQLFVTLMFAGFTVWWISFQHNVEQSPPVTEVFGNTYFIMALTGVIIGFGASRKWGGLKTTLGKTLAFFSFSLFLQVAGQIIYAYYVSVLNVETPYPSLGDVAYFGSALAYCYAAYQLALTAGITLENKVQKAVAVIVPFVWIVGSTYVLLRTHQFDFSQPMTVFLDIAYPIVDAIYVSIAIVAYVLSKPILGGSMKRGIMLIILALMLAYLADFTFIYQANSGGYVGGSYVDFTYLLAYFVMSTAMVMFYSIRAAAPAPASNGAVQAAASGHEIFDQLARRIIERQESIIGSWAVEQAGQIEGLVVNWPQQVATVSDKPQETIDRLVARYTALFGDTAIKTCKEAVARYKHQIPADQLPASLQ